LAVAKVVSAAVKAALAVVNLAKAAALVADKRALVATAGLVFDPVVLPGFMI
jgi:hypothetical protein